MRFVIAGLGSIGRRHAQNLRSLRPDAEIFALRRPPSEGRDTDRDSAEPAVDYTIFDLEEAISEDPDAAIITNPAPYHTAFSIEFARHGIPLFVEKPLADAMDGVDELLKICREQDLCLQVGYNFRFYEPLRQLRELTQADAIGSIWGAWARAGSYLPNWRPGRDYRNTVSARSDLGGGAVLELSHEFDYLRWILGEPLAVRAQTRTSGFIEVDVEDHAEAIIEFEAGVLASVHLSMIQRPPTRRVRLFGTEGIASCDLLNHRVEVRRSPDSASRTVYQAEELDTNEMYLQEMSHFLDCIEGKVPPAVSGEDGRSTLRLALAVKRSADNQRRIAL